MKKLFVFSAIAVCLAFSKVKAQTVNGVRLSEIRATYIEVSEFRRPASDRILIKLEFGQKVVNQRADAVIKDDNGKELEFNSVIDCINKLKNYGYELAEVYVTQSDGSTNGKYYILKRK
jgi:hypothetical protein